MPNIRIPNASGHIEINKQDATIITLATADKYVPTDIEVAVRPHVGSFNNVATSNVVYTENTDANTIIPEDGYLYLNKGWFENTRISLGHLIPDDTQLPNAGSDKILNGFEAYDTDGNKLVGTIATITPVFDGGTVTVHPSATMSTQPTATITPDGSFVDLAGTGASNNLYGGYYGVSTSNSGMTSYLTVDGVLETTEGTASVTTTYDRSAVQYDGATTGFVDKADDTVALLAVSGATGTGTSVTTTIVGTDNFVPHYIPIVRPKGFGGAVTRTGGSGTISGLSPELDVEQTGSLITQSNTFGVLTTAPSGQTDGMDYLTFDVSASQNQTAQTWSGTAQIDYSRAEVTQSGDCIGATHFENGDELLGSATGTLEQSVSGNVTATLGTHQARYIPIVEPTAAGGDLSAGTLSVTPSGTFTVTPSIKPLGYDSNDGEYNVSSSAFEQSYGIYYTIQPGEEDKYVFFDAKAAAGGSITASGSVSVTRGAVTVTTNAGITNQSKCHGFSAASPVQYTGDTTITSGDGVSISEGDDLYIVEATDSLSLTLNSITVGTQPSVTTQATATYHTSSSDTTGTAISLSNSTQSTAYVEFNVTGTPSDGTVSVSASATQGEGITKGNTRNTNSGNVNVTPTYTSTKVRMNVYEGGYAVDGTIIA